MLQASFCRQRQRRLLAVMERRKLDAVVVGQSRHVYSLSGHLPFWLHESAFVLFSDGRSLLFTANTPAANVAADDVRAFDATWMGTQRQEQPELVAEQVAERFVEDRLTDRLRADAQIGLDASPVTAELMLRLDQCSSIDHDLWQLRRRKDPDELELMKKAIACTEAMYERARRIIEPGIPELRVFAELHAAAVETACEPLSPAHLGNDFQCGSRGGPPRAGRVAQAGELYILDLGPAYRGYFSDNSRAFSVDRKPTDAQLKGWQTVTGAFPIVERMARPGVRCRDIFAAVEEHYRGKPGKAFPHHLGHGVGLQPHEFPHLNPKWDDALQEGEVFTCEPGLYGPELAAGMRIENQYLVAAEGVTNLTPFPMELT